MLCVHKVVPHLVVEALDADKHLPQRRRPHHICLPLHDQPPARLHHLHRDVVPLLGRQHGKQVREGERVVQIAQGVQERGVALAHERVEAVAGLAGEQALREREVLLGARLADLAVVRLEVSVGQMVGWGRGGLLEVVRCMGCVQARQMPRLVTIEGGNNSVAGACSYDLVLQ